MNLEIRSQHDWNDQGYEHEAIQDFQRATRDFRAYSYHIWRASLLLRDCIDPFSPHWYFLVTLDYRFRLKSPLCHDFESFRENGLVVEPHIPISNDKKEKKSMAKAAKEAQSFIEKGIK